MSAAADEHPHPWRWSGVQSRPIVGVPCELAEGLVDANGRDVLAAVDLGSEPFIRISSPRVRELLEAAPEMRAALDKIIEVAEGMTALAANDRQVHPDDFAEEWAAVKEVRELLARIEERSK